MQRFFTTNGMEFRVSDIDAPMVAERNWYGHTANASKKPYVRTEIKRQVFYLHRRIAKAPASMRVDHRDTDTLNNQRPNLRLATHNENNFNRCGFGLSGFKGVTRDKSKWRARITFEETTRNLGRFEDAEAAARAYDLAAFELFGEFAWLNFPEDLIRGKPDMPFFD